MGQLLWLWLALGAQSFGGGAATLTLIRREIVDRRGWMSAEEFTREWSLCQVAPGINLLGITILIGRRLAGGPGIVVALAGLLLPSVVITVLMTAFYARVRYAPIVQAALQGILPATVGLGLVTSWDVALPLLQSSRQEGTASLGLSLLLLAGAGLAVALGHLSVVLALCAAGAVGALARPLRQRAQPEEDRP
ncbi:MAG TPA: chromate transporter [Chthonomonadaceae bacterium]|nr:chromate transporter [Chthonomonadaceae bacterium]